MKRLAIIFLLFIASGCTEKPDSGSGEQSGTSFRLMSFNVRYSNGIDAGDLAWDSRREACFAMLHDIAPDVAGLQEPRSDQRAEFIDEFTRDYGFVCVPQNDEIKWEQTGFVMLMYLKSKYRLADSGYFWLSATPETPSLPFDAADGQYRTCVWAQLKDKDSGKEFYVFNTHYPSATEDNEPRRLSTELILSKMKSIAGRSAAIFLTGDLNSSYYTKDERRSCLEPYYQWMWAARDSAPDTDTEYSYNSFGDGSTPSARWNLDHIFYRNATAVQFRTITNENYGVRYISDHYPIILTCTLI